MITWSAYALTFHTANKDSKLESKSKSY
jgi:hypothetical protein